MVRMNDLPGVAQGCVPRKDVIDSAYELEAFAADLNLVIEGKKGYLYSDPDDFFKNIFISNNLKTTKKEIFRRHSGSDSCVSITSKNVKININDCLHMDMETPIKKKICSHRWFEIIMEDQMKEGI